MINYDKLIKIDEHYFHGQEDLSEEKVAYRLATWLFDKEGREEECRKKIKEILPEVYMRALENYVDGNHDT